MTAEKPDKTERSEELVAWVRPASMSANVPAIRVFIDHEHGGWTCALPGMTGSDSLGTLHEKGVQQIERALEVLLTGHYWLPDDGDPWWGEVELHGRDRLSGCWKRFWKQNVCPRRTQAGVAALEFMELMKDPATRLHAWIAARGIVLSWEELSTGRGRLDDPRLGIPFDSGAWDVEVIRLFGGRGRIHITDRMTISEFW